MDKTQSTGTKIASGVSSIMSTISDPGKAIANMNEQFAAGVIIMMILFLLVLMILNLYLMTQLESRECSRMNNMYPTLDGKLRSLTSTDALCRFTLKDYYIKTAYNAFEIYSLNNVPIIATSTVDSYYVKETYNYVKFSDVMSTIQNYAYSNSTCPNPTDPIILHFRIKSTNQTMYSAMATTLKTYDQYLLGPQYSFENSGTNLGNAPLLSLLGKIIIIVEKDDNTSYMENVDFYEYVNMTSNSVFMRSIKYYDAKFTPDMYELQEYNKQNMCLVKPDIGVAPPNCSAILTRALGCQMVGMRYQLNDAFLQEDTAFFDACGYAFCLKPAELRYIPIELPDPPQPNPELAYAPRTLQTDYYNYNI